MCGGVEVCISVSMNICMYVCDMGVIYSKNRLNN